MPTLYHWTCSASAAASITSLGFRDTPYDPVDDCGKCLGVWFCEDANKHKRGRNDVRLEVDVSVGVMVQGMQVPCLTDPLHTVDWLIPASLVNKLEIRLDPSSVSDNA